MHNFEQFYRNQGFPGGSAVKNPPANAGDTGSIPGSGRSLEKEMATHLIILDPDPLPLQVEDVTTCWPLGTWLETEVDDWYSRNSMVLLYHQPTRRSISWTCILRSSPLHFLPLKILVLGQPAKWIWDKPVLPMGFPNSSVGKESTCNAGDPGLRVSQLRSWCLLG